MKNTELIQNLLHFSQDELEDFSIFIQIKSLHRNKKLANDSISLFNYIKKYLKSSKKKCLEKEIVFSQLFKDSPYVENRMRQLRSELIFLVKRWLLLNNQTEEEQEIKLEKNIEVLKIYKKKYSQLGFTKRLSKIINNKLEHSTNQNSDYHFNQMSFMETLMQKNEAILDYIYHLNNYYYFRKNQYQAILIHRKENYVKGQFDEEKRATLIKECDKPIDEENTAVQLIKTLYNFLQKKEEEEFKEFKSMLLKEDVKKYFTPKEQTNFLAFAISYCTQKINEGKFGYIKDYKEIHKLMLSNILSPTSKVQELKNYIGISLGNLEEEVKEEFGNTQTGQLKKLIDEKIEELEKRIEEVAQTVSQDFQKDIVNYNQARIDFFHAYLLHTYCSQKMTLLHLVYLGIEDVLKNKQEEDKQEENLRVIKFQNKYIRIEAWRLLAKTYYELFLITNEDKYKKQTMQILNSLNVFLRAKKNSLQKNTFIVNGNFKKWLGKIIRSKQLETLKVTKQEIIEAKSFSETQWLLQKVEQKIDLLISYGE